MHSKSKILFVPGSYPFCYYYRAYLPGVYSRQMVVSDFMRKDAKFSGERLLEQAMEADIIVFQRPTGSQSPKLAKLLKLKGKKIIFENDDTYAGIPLFRLGNDKQREIAIQQGESLKEFMRESHGCIASTQVLGDEFSKINPNTVVLKNCIDPLDYVKCKENTTGKFRIGFIGSVTSNDDYEHIKDDIRKIDARGDTTIVILGVKHADGEVTKGMTEDYEFWSTIKNIEWHPYCHVTEYMSTIASLALDVAIIPRKEHYFNECKSNLKFLEMSLLKIPVLAQGFKSGNGPYDDPVDKQYMTVIQDSWYDYIVDIKNNYSKYKALAVKAHDYVLEHYNIKTYSQEWVKQIHKLCS